jgi:hypothetical protein
MAQRKLAVEVDLSDVRATIREIIDLVLAAGGHDRIPAYLWARVEALGVSREKGGTPVVEFHHLRPLVPLPSGELLAVLAALRALCASRGIVDPVKP